SALGGELGYSGLRAALPWRILVLEFLFHKNSTSPPLAESLGYSGILAAPPWRILLLEFL
ncbi:MAG: hypothetical protein LBL19_08385, partial [Spirochaetaceae bacterium]|nr:hypothetical protein [Spirochaetaceae bacterium]